MVELTHGMDLAQVEELGRFLIARGEALEGLSADVDRRLRSSSWSGVDADRFRQAAWPGHRAKLHDAASGIAELGQLALKNAAEQRKASSEGLGSSIETGAGLGICVDPTADPANVREGRSLSADLLDLTGDGDQIPGGQIQIRRQPNGTVIVVMPGVEDLTSSLEAGKRGAIIGMTFGTGGAIAGFITGVALEAARSRGTSRDLRYTSPTAFDPGNRDRYAAAVRAALDREGIPHGTRIMLVGHSGGAYSAASLASDPSFNDRLGSGGDYDVSHVLAAEADTDQFLPLVPQGTSMVVMNNENDVVVRAEQASDLATGRFDTSAESPSHHEESFGGGIGGDAGHHPRRDSTYVRSGGGGDELDRFAAGASEAFGDFSDGRPTNVAVPDR